MPRTRDLSIAALMVLLSAWVVLSLAGAVPRGPDGAPGPDAPTPMPIPEPRPEPVAPAPAPAPKEPVPAPAPAPAKPRPRCPLCPRGLISAEAGPIGPGGTEVMADIPAERRMRNRGGSDGSGMCVTTSATVAADWSNLKGWLGLRDWAAKSRGGSWPDKHLRQLKQYAEFKGLPPAPWAQYTGPDPGPFLDAVLSSGRMACVSWSKGGHWLNLVYLDGTKACVMDNNGDPNNCFTWMSRAECLREISTPYAWCGSWTAPGPPPPPRSVAPKTGACDPCDCCGDCDCASSPRPIRRPAPPRAPLVEPPGGWPHIPDGVFRYSEDSRPRSGAYNLHGRPSATLDEVKAALAAPEKHLTVIGDEGAVRRVLADLVSIAAPGKLAVQGYAPGDWALSCGFATRGAPTVYYQDAKGLVLHRQDGYDGPAALAKALAEGDLRKPRPDYDPSKDPDRRRPAPPPFPPVPVPPGPLVSPLPDVQLPHVPWSAYVLAGAGALVVATGNRKRKRG